MDIPYIVFPGVCLMGLAVRTGYELLKKAGKIDPKNQLIFCLVFIAMCLLLAGWPFVCHNDPRQVSLPDPIRRVGDILGLMGLEFAVAGLVQLRGLENIDHLVTGGIYSKIRHPMYSGFILWILGWVIHSGALTGFLIVWVCIINILGWRKLEEEKLRVQFGEVYPKYCKKTWF